MERKPFWDVFKHHADGSIEPIVSVKIAGVQLGPVVRFGKGVSFGGVDFSMYIGHDLVVKEQEGVTVIVGIF